MSSEPPLQFIGTTTASFTPSGGEGNVYDEIAVNVGPDTGVRVVKMFGPTIFADLRVTIDMASSEWVVERHVGDQPYDSQLISGGTPIWKEYARIPAQLPEDFEGDQP